MGTALSPGRRGVGGFAEARAAAAGYTLLEVVTVALIVAILLVLVLPVVGGVRSRMERVRCVKNLQNLHVAANLYVQEHGSWPQIDPSRTPDVVAGDWIDALQPYGMTVQGWLCPTVQRLLRSPDITQPANRRTDYGGFPFSPEPQRPFQYATEPWFFEKNDVHGRGHLLIFRDGHIQTLGELIPKK